MMRKKLLSATLAGFLMVTPAAYAGGVPTFDGVNVGLQMRNVTEQLVQSFRILEQYKNQFGEVKAVVEQLERLTFIQTADGYIPENWNEAVQILQGLSDDVPPEIQGQTYELLELFSNINISDEKTKAALQASNKAAVREYELYLSQMKVAQDRLRSTSGLTASLKNVETQKEREAITAQINIENLKASAEIANILASKNAKDHEDKLMAQQQRLKYLQDLERFANGD